MTFRQEGPGLLAAAAAMLCLAAPPAQGQETGLEGLLGGEGGALGILEGLNSGEMPGAVGDLLDGLNGTALEGSGPNVDEGLRALGVLGEILGNTMPGAPAVASRSDPRREDLARAAACDRPLGTLLPDPMVDRMLGSGFGTAAADPEALRGLVGMLRSLATDACSLRDIMVLEALVDALSGRYNAAAATLDALMPSPGEAQGSLALLAASAHAAVLALQLREDEARAMIDELRPAAIARLGVDNRLVLMLDGALADMDMALGRTARAVGDEARAAELFDKAGDAYRALTDNSVVGASLGPADELSCIARSGLGAATLMSGDAAAASEVLDALLAPGGTCARSFPADSLLGARARMNLGLARLALGDLPEAEAALSAALATARRLRGDAHPEVIRATRALAELRALQGRADDAVALVARMDDSLLSWLGGSLRGTTSAAQRRRVAALQAGHQDTALLIALEFPEHPGAQEAAAQAVLRYKGMQGEEDALMNRLAAQAADDPRVAALAREIAVMRSDLAAAANAGAGVSVAPGLSRAALAQRERALSDAEAQLQRLSGQFDRQVAVRAARVTDVRARLGTTTDPAALVEYRLVRKRALGGLESGSDTLTWVAVVLTADETRVEELATAQVVALLIADVERPDLLAAIARGEAPREVLAATRTFLWEALVAPLGLSEMRRIYLAPEGALTLAPLMALEATGGGLWADPAVRRVVVLPSGRVLLSDDAPGAGGVSRRLLALGGVAYGAPQPGGPNWQFLPRAAAEVEAVAALTTGTSWHAETLRGEAASEAALRARLGTGAPGILHLATHGFFRGEGGSQDRLSVRSGIALAGANAGGSGPDDDGTLYALEVETLSLQDTLLVTVSACETALGPVERGEGVHGLNRAFRIAGARHSLVTLRPVGDRQAERVMQTFYGHLFDGGGASAPEPALAFQRTVAELSDSAEWVDIGAFTLIRHR